MSGKPSGDTISLPQHEGRPDGHSPRKRLEEEYRFRHVGNRQGEDIYETPDGRWVKEPGDDQLIQDVYSPKGKKEFSVHDDGYVLLPPLNIPQHPEGKFMPDQTKSSTG